MMLNAADGQGPPIWMSAESLSDTRSPLAAPASIFVAKLAAVRKVVPPALVSQ